ncbi:MAG: hypothetical protein KatS3mg121_0534 [Gammaproteobacteria bacterium]|nr:MAG: hypothetical protein KatS3mg121_0534 [Gammaproteobacteria bacterium]
MRAVTLWHRLALAAHLGLIAWIVAFNVWLDPPARHWISLLIVLLCAPLLLALRGMLHGRPYSHAWMSLLAPFYFALGVGVVAGAEDRRYGGGLILLSALLFVATIGYLRSRRSRVTNRTPS